MASGARQVTGFPSPITGPRRRQSRKRAAQPARTTRAMLAKLLFAGGQKNSPGCSASSASNDGSYRTSDESAA